MSVQIHRLHVGIAQQAENRYLEVPFDVSATSSVEVSVDVADPTAVIDLGCLGPAGWRGWSGGARTGFVIGPHAATPGYLPGETEDGRWAVVLGLHWLPAEGVEVTVSVRTPATRAPEAEPPDPPVVGDLRRGSSRGLPAPAGLRWYAGDMHAHTVHSDGSQSIGWLAAEAAAAGLDFLAVTDHNTVSHHQRLPVVALRYGIGLIPGQEVTSARGHANAFGDIGWIDFRLPADEWVAQTQRRGGLLSINHAIDADCAWQHPLRVHPPLLEVWHTTWFPDATRTGILAFWQAWGTDAIPIGGSDFHRPDRGGRDRLGAPTTWVAATDPSPEAIMAAVAQGRTALSAGPWDPVLLRVGDDLVAVDGDGTVLVDADGRRRPVYGNRVTLAADVGGAGTGPYRLESADRRIVAISP